MMVRCGVLSRILRNLPFLVSGAVASVLGLIYSLSGLVMVAMFRNSRGYSQERADYNTSVWGLVAACFAAAAIVFVVLVARSVLKRRSAVSRSPN